MRRILTILFAIIVCVAVAIAAYYLVIRKNNTPLLQSTSPNILYLTNPVTSFSGIIEGVQGNTITISQDMVISQPLFNQSPTAKPQTKKITYQVLVNKASIIQSPNNIPYLFKQPVPVLATASATTKPLNAGDLKVGQFVNASANTDLRTLPGNQFEATSINILPNVLSINGRITNISGNVITLIGLDTVNSSLMNSVRQEKEYKIVIDPNTEISSNIVGNKSEKFSLSDLKKDLQATVFAEGASDNQSLKALRIIPVIINLPLPQSSPSGTTIPK